jgi:group II intron reverse transcriptase/maturase
MKTGFGETLPAPTEAGKLMSTQLSQIAKRAKLDRKARFTSLAHLLTPEFLTETWGKMNRRAAGGIDGVSAKQFEGELGTQVEVICAQLKAGTYRAPPVRRVEIPKGPGKVGTRPLGIPTAADRLLQRAVARILDAVFEADFLECSYGFRPGRNPHHALQALREQIVTKKVMQVFEADIRSYFTRINRQWLRKMVAHRIADPVILGLIGKWLNAGAMQDGVVIHAEDGTPQGGPISPVLSNLYLHFVLDLWFEKKIKPQCRGESCLVRFADDFAVTFQFRDDADRFEHQVRKRFADFGLELAEEKTRRMLFGRFAAITRLRHRLGRPETFEFLGFKHVCGVDRSGRFTLVRIPCAKSCRKFLLRTREWIFEHRHWKRWEQQQHLTRMLRGFYQYFALHHCERKLSWVRQEVQRQWLHALNRRGQPRRLNWTRLKDRSWFDLPFAHNLHPTV